MQHETCAIEAPNTPTHAPKPAIGDILDGRYQLLRELGRVGARAVYIARHLFTGRFVAVKMVQPDARATRASELHAQLQREGRALASIRHAGVADAFDGGVTLDGAPYVVMEVVEGRTLEGMVAARGTLSEQNMIGAALQLCSALQAIHRAGVVHRDVKPSNVVVVRDGEGCERIKLVNFHIAQVQGKTHEPLSASVVGTPAYMCPERLLGLEDADASCDLYGLGVTMFECLSGTTPYSGSYAQVLLHTAAEAPAPALRSRAPWVQARLAAVVDRAIARNKSARFRSARELLLALQALPGASATTALLGPALGDASATGESQSRRSRRVPYNAPAQIMVPEGALEARSEDISEGGGLLVTHDRRNLGQKVQVQIALPMEGSVASMVAHVRWIHDTHDLRAVGLEFSNAPPALVAQIARYVDLVSERVRP